MMIVPAGVKVHMALGHTSWCPANVPWRFADGQARTVKRVKLY